MTLNRLHGVICQKIELFIMTGVRTSNPTDLFSIKTETKWINPKIVQKHK
jgi:hypothetical protein